MKRTSFLISGETKEAEKIVSDYLPSFEKDSIKIEQSEDSFTGTVCTVYVKYDDTDVSLMKELETCFMHVLMLDDYIDAWNMIQEYSENI